MFFAAMAVICALLVPAMPSEFRWVAWFSAALGAFWAVAMALEDVVTPGKPRPRRPGPVRPQTPFGPPPPPGASD